MAPGDISPNILLDAISAGKLFVVARFTEIFEKIKGAAILADPQSAADRRAKALCLCNENDYKAQKTNASALSHAHSRK